MKINTTNYTNTHGTTPKGKAFWMFRITISPAADCTRPAIVDEMVWHDTYAEAARKAKYYAKAHRAVAIELCA